MLKPPSTRIGMILKCFGRDLLNTVLKQTNKDRPIKGTRVKLYLDRIFISAFLKINLSLSSSYYYLLLIRYSMNSANCYLYVNFLAKLLPTLSNEYLPDLNFSHFPKFSSSYSLTESTLSLHDLSKIDPLAFSLLSLIISSNDRF